MWWSRFLHVVASCAFLVRAELLETRVVSVSPDRLDLSVTNTYQRAIDVQLVSGRLTSISRNVWAASTSRSEQCLKQAQTSSLSHNTFWRSAENAVALLRDLEHSFWRHGLLSLMFHWDPSESSTGLQLAHHDFGHGGFCYNASNAYVQHWIQQPKNESRFLNCEHHLCNGIVRDIYLSDVAGFGVVYFHRETLHSFQKLGRFIKELICHPAILKIEVDRLVHRSSDMHSSQTTLTPDDPEAKAQWYLSDTKVNQAWAINSGKGNKSPIVMVIDSGTQISHPDIAANLYKNTAELQGKAGVDDDGNGYIDDVYGIHVEKGVIDGNVIDTDGHGTFCAGVIGAVTDNAIGVAGMTWGGQILTCKFMTSGGAGSFSDAAICIDYAIKMKAKVISASWGGATQTGGILPVTVQKAGAQGISFVSAAGNSGTDMNATPNYPACWNYNNTISVGATLENTSFALFSNFGTNCVALAAPGDHIFNLALNSEYEYRGGTSMSTPIVAGTIALMLQANPNLTVVQRNSILQSTVQKNAAYASKVKSSGRVNAYAAIIAARSASSLSLDNGDFTNLGDVKIRLEPDETFTFPIFAELSETDLQDSLIVSTEFDLRVKSGGSDEPEDSDAASILTVPSGPWTITFNC